MMAWSFMRQAFSLHRYNQGNLDSVQAHVAKILWFWTAGRRCLLGYINDLSGG